MKVLYHPDKTDMHLSSVLYALSDPVRLSIVSEIRKLGECTCGGIEVDIVKSTLSHHVRTMREAGVVRVRVQGTQRFLSLRKDDLEERFPGLLTAILHAYESSEEQRMSE
ncbi:ArsR/SmtB family transcription factor [Paenibacillus roseipurpureus]|uniref:Helix-turn-helix domain-containing protein n=1 Tax=Paenibacillus roseopurpureus TaxID=2918901 RepID=A0AA96RMX7_9BACL|nr:helix-turn-helix domain-containing protein [Paenibacillus sp. MBLB1832]WNR47150.1 helix-turn-helix domain-containing protein [Paenibacillus sp. MBLB1832]